MRDKRGQFAKGQEHDFPDHQRCQRMRRTGQRCRKGRVRGSRYCRTHGGRASPSKTSAKITLGRMPAYYSKYLPKTLEAAVAEAMGEADPRQALQLFEELALMRTHAGEAVRMYGIAHQLPVNGETPKEEAQRNAAIKLQAGEVMCAALTRVQAMCESAAKIEASGKDKYSIFTLKSIVAQIVRIMYKVCGTEHEDLAREFERQVLEDVRMPQETQGTDLEPSDDVIEMDATVPRIESK